MSESWVEVLQINIREMKRLETQHPEFADELKLIIALGNENLKRNGLYPRIISKQRDAKAGFQNQAPSIHSLIGMALIGSNQHEFSFNLKTSISFSMANFLSLSYSI